MRKMKLSTFFKRHGWCRGSMALDKSGGEVPVNDPRAKSFCLRGGMSRIGMANKAIDSFRDFIILHSNYTGIFDFNDRRNRTKKQVIAMCEKFEASQRKGK